MFLSTTFFACANEWNYPIGSEEGQHVTVVYRKDDGARNKLVTNPDVTVQNSDTLRAILY